MPSNILSASLPASASGRIGPQSPNLTIDYKGFTVRESTGTSACAIRIRDGGVVTGNILEEISLAPGESAADEYAFGRHVGTGLYVELVQGTMPTGAVFYG